MNAVYAFEISKAFQLNREDMGGIGMYCPTRMDYFHQKWRICIVFSVPSGRMREAILSQVPSP